MTPVFIWRKYSLILCIMLFLLQLEFCEQLQKTPSFLSIMTIMTLHWCTINHIYSGHQLYSWVLSLPRLPLSPKVVIKILFCGIWMDFLQLPYSLHIQNFCFYVDESVLLCIYVCVTDVNLNQISLFPRQQAKDEPVQS